MYASVLCFIDLYADYCVSYAQLHYFNCCNCIFIKSLTVLCILVYVL